MPRRQPRGTWQQLGRFLLVGGSNTVVTAALLVLLQTWWPAPLAFTVTYVLGVAYTVALTGRVVFGATWSARSAAAYAGWYVLVYLVGLGVIHLAQALGDPSPWQVAVLTVLTTAPLNFLGGRLIFTRPGTVPPPPGDRPASASNG